MLLLRLNLRRTVRQAVFSLGAVLLAVLAAAMLNVALYQLLLPRLDGAGAALVVALADLAVAGTVLLAAGRHGEGAEYEAANKLRESLMADLAGDVERLRTQFKDLQEDIHQIRATATGLFKPGGISIASIGQWLMLLFRVLRR